MSAPVSYVPVLVEAARRDLSGLTPGMTIRLRRHGPALVIGVDRYNRLIRARPTGKTSCVWLPPSQIEGLTP